MAKQNIAPTKSNLLAVKEQLRFARDGYELLEQKREILVMELMRIVEQAKTLESDIDKVIKRAYPALKEMLISMGAVRVEQIGSAVNYDFQFKENHINIAGIEFPTLDVLFPKRKLFYSFLDSYAESDKVMVEFFELLRLLTEMASIRTIAWRLAGEVKKTQRRVNALDKMVLPQSVETEKYIESVLEERERENIFVLKVLKARQLGENG